MPVNSAHQRYVDYLFAQASAGRYPSHQILKRIEAAITDRETAERYVDLLLSEAENQRFPSLRMLDRANQIVTRMAAADVIERLDEEFEAANG
ncbi:hypothetical protein ER308_03325 [Egibacter rhizosphaerae]|uniref:Uncharacterized protein n=1 Tax=Egibacter rhizosphaerae TaxID=1670831 RepID=A0A411YBV4_9ACTN|nr:hypothetical protein [Egibacter rhizosphaerae]QBI18684.1 hypothetical protein ER308_03325 [Egibacter rhizosphaerae]